MVFSSPIFLFLFLPLALAGFFAGPRALRTPFLVSASLLFYAWGEKQIVFLLLASIVLNWGLALTIERVRAPRGRKLLLAATVFLNIGALVYFKYTNFLVANLNRLFHVWGPSPLDVPLVHLPIGVSFVTFEALSYVVDVYRGDTPAARNPLHVAFYVSFFPHLIAGPILRFRDIAGAVARPAVSLELFESGVSRFSVGLAKKMLLANPLGAVADTIFGLGAGQLRTSTAWLGIVAYALQIYFDFSGYSDMAIGLGRMFGFSLPENFRLPYAAESIQDFWRRWHVTLSSWFRDYVFIPLGGSRGTRTRTYRNLILVFLLCGLWHGASWNFAIWGLFHGTFLVLERSPFGGWLKRAWRPLRHAYAILVISIGWVFFRADSLGAAAGYLASMAGATVAAGPRPVEYFSTHFGFALACGALLSVAPVGKLRDRLLATNDERWRAAWRLGAAFGELALVFTSMLFVASDTYSPFIYFRF